VLELWCKSDSWFVYGAEVSRRRLKRRTSKTHRQPPAFEAATTKQVVVREATRVERLAYTRTQAAEACDVFLGRGVVLAAVEDDDKADNAGSER
jgi:hypothetical protein